MTDEDICIEYEAVLAFQGETLKTCPNCKTQTHAKACVDCGIKLTGDQIMDSVSARIEAGEEIADLDALLRPSKTEKFEPLTPGDLP